MSIGIIILLIIFSILCAIWVLFGGDIIQHLRNKSKENKEGNNLSSEDMVPSVSPKNHSASGVSNSTNIMRYCMYCGEKLPEDSCYCPKCGHKVPLNK